jgi:3-methylcrotonyl-CoA carboxylase alpha subunit
VSEGIRVDAGVTEGDTVTVHYDPLISKLVAWGATRNEAIGRMTSALCSYDILGLRHNLSFLLALLRRDDVLESRVHTRFIEEKLEVLAAPPDAGTVSAAAALAAWASTRQSRPAVPTDEDDLSALDPWALLGSVAW